ncbi:MAG: hypothetical protein ACJ74K_09015 [Actinomycetes bacterium]|jgi:hypothetical protein
MATPTAGGILRIGSYAGIAGALLGLVGNLLHPATPIGDPEGVARTIADSRLWVPDHLAIVLGLILMLGGLVAIAHSIQDGLPAALARLGSVAAVAGITVGLILVTLDGLAVAWSRTYPRWLGWIVVVAGAGSVVAGLIQAAAGEPTTVTRVLTIIFPTVITLWLVEMNLLVLRKAPALQRAITQDP